MDYGCRPDLDGRADHVSTAPATREFLSADLLPDYHHFQGASLPFPLNDLSKTLIPPTTTASSTAPSPMCDTTRPIPRNSHHRGASPAHPALLSLSPPTLAHPHSAPSHSARIAHRPHPPRASPLRRIHAPCDAKPASSPCTSTRMHAPPPLHTPRHASGAALVGARGRVVSASNLRRARRRVGRRGGKRVESARTRGFDTGESDSSRSSPLDASRSGANSCYAWMRVAGVAQSTEMRESRKADSGPQIRVTCAGRIHQVRADGTGSARPDCFPHKYNR
ncbi:hypothetical protein C8R43DRAFT_1202099 [Mycena crocata]|nr:hypothetical protein C8R43DRAFT_1202099 [Mycena crocata]